jgi:hypothetical protein
MFPRRGLGVRNLSGDVNPREKIMPILESFKDNQIILSLEKLSKYRASILGLEKIPMDGTSIHSDLTPDGSNIPIHETFMDAQLTQRS